MISHTARMLMLAVLVSTAAASDTSSQYQHDTALAIVTQQLYQTQQASYQIGYQARNGETLTHVLRFDKDGQQTNESTFEDSIYQMTSFNGKTYAIQMDGESFVWADQDWQPTNFNFDMLTKIISHDQNLIYCSATFPSKAMMNQGKCMGEGWKSAQNVF